MKLYKRFAFEDGCETLCVFDCDEHKNFAEIIGAENFFGEWYYFALSTACDCGKLDDSDYVNWLLYDKNDGNGFGCGSFSSLEDLVNNGKSDYCDTEDLRHFLEN